MLHLQFLVLKGFLGIFSTAIQIARDSSHSGLKIGKKCHENACSCGCSLRDYVPQRLKLTFLEFFSRSTGRGLWPHDIEKYTAGDLLGEAGVGCSAGVFPKMLTLAFEANSAMTSAVALFSDFSSL